MAKAAKRPVGSWSYIPLGDRGLPQPEQSVFTLTPLTGEERERIVDNAWHLVPQLDGSVVRVSRSRSLGREVALRHIANVTNFPSNAPQPWPNGKHTDEDRATYAEMFDDELVQELGNEVYLRSTLGPEEAKHVGESSPPAPISN